MKIASLGLEITPGKQKFSDEKLVALEKKFAPKKVTPFVVEFIGEDFVHADAIVCSSGRKLDLIIEDLGKLEQRQLKTQDAQEKELLSKIKHVLENEKLVSDCEFSEGERNILKTLAFLTDKPVVVEDDISDMNLLMSKVFEKSRMIFFYTAGPKEVHSWPLLQGSSALEAAGKIHSDLARGFIRAEIVNFRELDKFHNFNDARQKGLVKSVEKDHPIEDGDIIEIKFSV